MTSIDEIEKDTDTTNGNGNKRKHDSDEAIDHISTTNSGTTSSLYLDTIDRSRLDFDFEKICSISLSVVNIYACLCCGKYFQGRGKSSYAYVHSVDLDHHVFINLNTLNIYILPEGYEVKSSTLDNIKYVVDPTYTNNEVSSLDTPPPITAFDLNHKQYYPGFIGINNIKCNDYSNVIIQILSHVPPIRDYLLLLNSATTTTNSESINRLSILVRKIWNPKAFKAHVSPHELLQHISSVSKKQFTPIKQMDPFFFLTWFLNHLDDELRDKRLKKKQKRLSKRNTNSIIHNTFQGLLLVQQQQLTNTSTTSTSTSTPTTPTTSTSVPFICLTLDLPPIPLFKGNTQDGAPVIPEVSLKSLLSKYNGQTTTTDEITKTIKKYHITRLPQYLILRIKRITRTIIGDSDERNPTVVSFSPTDLDMSPYTSTSATSTSTSTNYNLIANVVAEWENNQPHWKIQLLDKSRDQWFQIQNLLVEQIQRELLFLDESHIQIWQRQ